MGWFRKRQGDFEGYEDRAALKGFGGYEPVEPPPTFGVPPMRAPQAPPGGPAGPAGASTTPHGSGSRPHVRFRRPLFGLGGVALLFGALHLVAGVVVDGGGAATSAEAPAYAPVVPRPKTRVVVPAAVPGWQPVVQTDGTYAYDVPPDWTPEPGVIHGWESDGSRLALVTSAFVGEGFCERDGDAQRGGSGMTTARDHDTAAAAVATAEELARRAYTPEGGEAPGVEVAEPRPVRVELGGEEREASLVLAEVTVTAEGASCLPGTALVGALAIGGPSGGSTPVLVAYDAQDEPGVLSRERMTRLLTSLRTVPESERETTVVSPTR